MLPWERRFLRGAFGAGVSSAALSVARGNGKSALVAGIACGVVDPAGPLHGRRREVVVVASSFAQARIVFEDVALMLRERLGDLARGEWRHQDSVHTATLEHRASGARVRCVGSDPRRAHGLRPVLVLADEPAQWPTNTGERMGAALRTGLGKVPGFAVRGARDADRPLQSIGFPGCSTGAPTTRSSTRPQRTIRHIRARTWRKANPSAGHLPSLAAQLRREAREAKRDPSALASFRALRLNMGVGDVQERGLLDPDAWAGMEVEEVERTGWYVLGLDLGTSAAMSGAAGYWPESGGLAAVAAFPELPSLEERGLRDGVGNLYRRMRDRGELVQCGGRAVEIDGLLREVLARWGPPAAIAVDRWREDELRDRLDAIAFPVCELEVRGMGFRDGAEDVRAFPAGLPVGSGPSGSLAATPGRDGGGARDRGSCRQ